MTAGRLVNLYDPIDAAYYATEIHAVSQRLGHVPIFDANPRRDKALKEARNREARAQRAAGHPDARTVRYRIRTVVERTNARLKDEFGSSHVRVRGPANVACLLTLGLLALAVDQTIPLAAPQRRPTRTADPAPCSRTGSVKKRSPQNSPQTRPGLYPAVPLTPKRPSETNPRPTLPPLSVSPAILQEAQLCLYYSLFTWERTTRFPIPLSGIQQSQIFCLCEQQKKVKGRTDFRKYS